MPLLTLKNIDMAFGGPKLLNAVDLQIEAGDKIGLLGRNGMGKSTLLKIITGELQADGGRIEKPQTLQIQSLIQQVPTDTKGSIFEVVAHGLSEVGDVLARYHQVILELAHSSDSTLLKELDTLQHAIENLDGWKFNQRIEKILSQLELESDLQFDSLSGGLKRRVLLAQALVCEPDILLLDEPTNHLDIASITLLEKIVLDYPGAIIFITHDRSFLQAVASRIIELDRGQLTQYTGHYQDYLVKKAHDLEVEKTHNALFDKKLAQEEVWIRQGIKARRTRNEGRVRALEALRRTRQERRNVQGRVSMAVTRGEQSGKLVIEAENLHFKVGDRTIINDFSTTIERGDKIGIIGPNGCGKTTLINLLLGQLAPTSGKAVLGTKLEIAYFDQLRSQLDATKTVEENISQGDEYVMVNGKRQHVIGYCQDFLFTPQQARGSIAALSGGERHRVLLASLFAKPANFLVLDEPTNDLDLETLELLEELLTEFNGTVLVISHDRAFLNNVVTSTFVYNENGHFDEYVGGYDDYLDQVKQIEIKNNEKIAKPISKSSATSAKLNYKEQRELDQLPQQIENLEKEQQKLQTQLADPDFYKQGDGAVKELGQRLQTLEDEIKKLYLQWEVLSTKK